MEKAQFQANGGEGMKEMTDLTHVYFSQDRLKYLSNELANIGMLRLIKGSVKFCKVSKKANSFRILIPKKAFEVLGIDPNKAYCDILVWEEENLIILKVFKENNNKSKLANID